jgi:hypothetical protein
MQTTGTTPLLCICQKLFKSTIKAGFDENQATLLRTFQRALRFLLPTFLLRLGLAIYISK